MTAYTAPGIVHPHQKRDISAEMLALIPEILIKSRKREVVYTRQAAAYLLNRYTLLSCSSIGRLIGLDHATVLYSLKSVHNAKSGYNKELLEYVINLEYKLKQSGII